MAEENNSVKAENSPISFWIKVALIVNLLLFLGLLGLYGIKFFDAGSGKSDAEMLVSGDSASTGSLLLNIAYVHSDTLMKNYLMAEDMRREFDAEQKRLDNDLISRQRKFQQEVEKFQKDISNGSIGMEAAQQKEQELMQMQQELIQLNEKYSEMLTLKEIEMNNELFETISDFLDRYNSEKGYDFILSYSKGGNLLLAQPKHDITNEVMELMNAEYSNNKQ